MPQRKFVLQNHRHLKGRGLTLERPACPAVTTGLHVAPASLNASERVKRRALLRPESSFACELVRPAR